MKFSGRTRPYAVLGHPIGHTLSPIMHNAAFAALDMDAVYLAFDVAPHRLMTVLPAMADMGFGGVNLTIPLKQTAFANLEHLDESAVRLGAVNTVEILADNELKGHNTDGYGFLQALNESFGRGPEGLSVLVLGAGGAGRAVAITCASAGCRAIELSDADPGRAENTAREIAGLDNVRVCPADPAAWAEASRRSDIVVQATPVGMKTSDKSLLPPESFRSGQFVFDLVYMYPETPFMKAAADAGAKTANGLGMLLHQGARAFSLWTGQNAPISVMRKALEDSVYGPKT